MSDLPVGPRTRLKSTRVLTPYTSEHPTIEVAAGGLLLEEKSLTMTQILGRFRTPILLLVLMFSLAALLLIDFAQAGAQANVFYVATDGNDSTGNGSISNPWATITNAVDQVPDGSTILVRPGTYTGRVRFRQTFAQGITIRSEIPYQARLRNDSTVITCFYGQGVTIEGFDIAHNGSGSGALVIQIQDLIGEPGGADRVGRITLRNNILHDSYNNDILKINNGAERVLVEGNIFYNQTGSDEHIDINSVTDVVVQDNIFFNDFAGSGRGNPIGVEGSYWEVNTVTSCPR